MEKKLLRRLFWRQLDGLLSNYICGSSKEKMKAKIVTTVMQWNRYNPQFPYVVQRTLSFAINPLAKLFGLLSTFCEP
jgi:hypothetical protein